MAGPHNPFESRESLTGFHVTTAILISFLLFNVAMIAIQKCRMKAVVTNESVEEQIDIQPEAIAAEPATSRPKRKVRAKRKNSNNLKSTWATGRELPYQE